MSDDPRELRRLLSEMADKLTAAERDTGNALLLLRKAQEAQAIQRMAYAALAGQRDETQAENTRLKAELDWLFDNCKVVWFPPAKGEGIPYYYEHVPRVKECRDQIEFHMRQDLNPPQGQASAPDAEGGGQ